MGRFPSVTSAAAAAVAVLAGLAAGPALARAATPTSATTTTSRPRPPTVYNPTVTPNTIDNRHDCGHSRTATISTGTTGKVDRVTFRVELAGRTQLLPANPSGNYWWATLNGDSFNDDHGPGTVRAEATGPGGLTESGPSGFTVAGCPG